MPYDLDECCALAQLGQILLREGQLHDARIIFEGLAAIQPEDAAPFCALAGLAVCEGRWHDVVGLASAAIERRPTLATLMLRAEALAVSGRYAEATRDLDRIAHLPALDPEDPVIKGRAALALARIRRPGG